MSDLGAFVEIFVNEEYKNDLTINPKVIFDLGSNSGISALYFKLSYPEAKIFCFEPNSLVFNRLLKNTKQYSDDIICQNVAVADFDGLKKFYICKKNSLSSSFSKRESEGEYSEVMVKSIPSLLKELKIDKVDLMKFDIEGAEFKMFKNDFPFFAFNSMIGEIHLDLSESIIEKEDFLNKFRKIYSFVDVLNISEKRFILKVKQ